MNGGVFFFSCRRRHTRLTCDWSSDVCSSDLAALFVATTVLSAQQAAPPATDGAACWALSTVVATNKAAPKQSRKAMLFFKCRSEERRVGKECGSRRSQELKKRKTTLARQRRY